jgi:serine/threonine protein phosphatase PrpC
MTSEMLFGGGLNERALRTGLERSYRALARLARDQARRTELVDMADRGAPEDALVTANPAEPAQPAAPDAAAPTADPAAQSPSVPESGELPSGRDHQELDLGLMAGVTDRGLRHHRNEDAMALATAQTERGPAALAVVCDGVSSSDRPDEASLAASEAAVSVLLSAVRADEDLLQASLLAVRAAGGAVAALAGQSGGAPSATYVSAVLSGNIVTLCWLGDSRAYWLAADSDEAARRLTTDDSVAEQMVLAGLMSEDEALTAPQAHVVTRWLGGDNRESAPHVARFEPPGPGVLLLCSDGLWNYLPHAAELARLALPEALTSPLSAAVRLVQFALDAGGMDNITAVLAPFGNSGEPARNVAPPLT